MSSLQSLWAIATRHRWMPSTLYIRIQSFYCAGGMCSVQSRCTSARRSFWKFGTAYMSGSRPRINQDLMRFGNGSRLIPRSLGVLSIISRLIVLRTRQRCSVAQLERLPQHWIESELQLVWYKRQWQPLDKAWVQKLGNAQRWTANR